MTTTPIISAPTMLLSVLLKREIVDSTGTVLGQVSDVIVRLRAEHYPLLTGLVVRVGATPMFISLADVVAIDSEHLQRRDGAATVAGFERRDGEVLLRADVLGHRLIDNERAALVRAYDMHLADGPEGWVVSGLDVHKHRWLHIGVRHDQHPARDWRSFEPLIGHQPSARVRSSFGRLRRLKAAQIANIIEGASGEEQQELLDHVHADPELEADVFEELDDHSQAQLLKTRTAEQVADVLTRMRADDAADAVMDLPHERRQAVLDLLPEPHHGKVLALLGYNTATAGGLMGTDFLAASQDSSIFDALAVLRSATTHQPEALTTIYSLDSHGRLTGAISLVRALQVDPTSLLRDVAEPDPVTLRPDADIIDVTTCMADYNLLTVPVTDDHGTILGVITVDDALEAAIPQDWRHREPPQHPHTTRFTNGNTPD